MDAHEGQFRILATVSKTVSGCAGVPMVCQFKTPMAVFQVEWSWVLHGSTLVIRGPSLLIFTVDGVIDIHTTSLPLSLLASSLPAFIVYSPNGAHYDRVRQNRGVLSVCISVIARDIEHLFICFIDPNMGHFWSLHYFQSTKLWLKPCLQSC